MQASTATRSRREKVRLLSDCLRRMNPDERHTGVSYLTGTLPQGRIGLGYAALAITDECSLAGVVKAHVAAKETGLQLIVGSEFNLVEGIRLVALAPCRTAYAELSGLISMARRRSPKGEYRAALRDVIFHLKRCLLIWLPDDDNGDSDATRAYGLQLSRLCRGRLWLGVSHLLGNDETRRHLARTQLADDLGITLSVHAPYYINLASYETEKIDASRKRILDSCQRAHLMGARKVVFHAGFYQKRSARETYRLIRKEILDLQQHIRKSGWQVALCPEITGKPSQFGSTEELLELMQDTGCGITVDVANYRRRRDLYPDWRHLPDHRPLHIGRGWRCGRQRWFLHVDLYLYTDSDWGCQPGHRGRFRQGRLLPGGVLRAEPR